MSCLGAPVYVSSISFGVQRFVLTVAYVFVSLGRIWPPSRESDIHQTDDQHRPGCQGWEPAGGRHHSQGDFFSIIYSYLRLCNSVVTTQER